MTRMLMNGLVRFLKAEDGATAIEYALIVALIFLAIVTAVTTYAQATNAMYQRIANAVTGGS